MPQRGYPGRAVGTDAADGGGPGEPESQAARIKVGEPMLDRCGTNRPRKGGERQDADLREVFLKRIIRAGASAG